MFIAICIVIALIVWVLLFCHFILEGDGFFPSMALSLLTATTTGLTLLVVAIGSQYFAQTYASTSEAQSSSQKIIAMSNTSSISGGGAVFVTISTDDEYRYMTLSEDGSMKMSKISSDSTSIVEDADKNSASLETKTHVFDNELLRFLYGDTAYYTYTLHVPKNTVSTEFSVDVSK